MDTTHITEANQGKHLIFGTDILTIKATSQTTAGSMLMFEIRVPVPIVKITKGLSE